MHAVGMLSSYISQGVYTVAGPFHPFGGAVDIIVVRQQDGSFKSSPWYVKFGKFQGVLKSREKIVGISVNGSPADFHMYLDRTGEAYFLKDPEPDEIETVLSPPSAASSGDEIIDYEKRRTVAGHLMKSASEGAVIKQGFQIPEKYETPEVSAPQVTPNERLVNSTSAAAASTLVDVNLSGVSGEKVVVEKPETGKGNSKPPRSLLALMFGSKSPASLEVSGLSRETGKEAVRVSLIKQSSIGRAEMVAELLESRWSTGERSNCSLVDQTRAQHAEEFFKEVLATESRHHVDSPKNDGMQETALLIEPCDNLTAETQSRLEGNLSHCSAVGQGKIILLAQDLKDDACENVSKITGDRGNFSCLGVDIADSMVENNLAQTTENDNAEMIIMGYDGHLLSAPVVSESEQHLKAESDQASTSRESQLSSALHRLASQPSKLDKEQSEFSIINESAQLVEDVSVNELPMDSIIELNPSSMGPILGTTGGACLVGDEHDNTLQHVTPYIDKSVDPPITLDISCAFAKECYASLKPDTTTPFQVVEEDKNLACEKQETSEVISEDYGLIQDIVTVRDESALDSERNVEDEDSSIKLSDGENQILDFSVSAVMTEIESPESSHKVDLLVSKPLTGVYDFDERNSFQPYKFSVELCQALDSMKPKTGDIFMKPTGTQSLNTSSSISLSSNDETSFELPSLLVVSVPNASATSELCEHVIFDSAGNQDDAVELASPDCETDILQEFVTSADLAERPDCTTNSFNVGNNNTAVNDSSFCKGMTFAGTGEVDQVVGELEGTAYQKDLERFYSFKDSDCSIVDLEVTNNIFRDYKRAEDIHCFTDNENRENISGACDTGLEINTLLGSPDFRISESEYLFVESDGEGSRFPEDIPVRVVSKPVNIPRVSNQDMQSKVQNYYRLMPSSLPTHLSETLNLKDKCFCSHSLGSITPSFLDMDVDPNLARDNCHALIESSTEGDKPCITSEELDAGSSKHVNPGIPGNEKDSADIGKTGIEISLCRHLLTEGMGAEAAAKAFSAEKVSYDVFKCSGREMLANDRLVLKIGERYFPWVAAAPLVLGKIAFGVEVPQDASGAINVETHETEGVKAGDSGNNALVPSSGGWRLWPFPFRRSRTSKKDTLPSFPSKAIVAVTEAALKSPFTEELLKKNHYYSRYRRPKVHSYVPTSEQLASLNLKEGPNKVTFTFFTRVLGKQQVDARIYLWKWNTRIVISDVDGTITKSDVLGQFMPLVGKDWTQSGVTRLFSGIKENGYELLFLSARAIAQAYLTRQFLLNLKQDGETLPDGPIFISPDGLFPSLYREVIRRAPHEFKISCLEEIRDLFPMDVNPFYAGFGNRETDEISYLKVGIPKGKIFIINPRGEVVVNHRVDMRSYTSLHSLVDDMFPPISSSEKAQGRNLLVVQEDFNSWNYWKIPLPDIDIESSETRSQSAKKGADSRK